MRRFFPLLAVALLAVISGCAQTGTVTAARWSTFTPESPPTFRYPEGVRLATLNAEFLFDGVGDEGEASFPHKGDPAAAKRHRERVAEVIRWIDPDIIVLQEVENLQTLNLMISESLADLGYAAYLVQGHDYFTGQNVGVLSRLPVDSVGRTDLLSRTGAGMQFQNVSKNIVVRMNLAGLPTTLIGIHLLARPDDPLRKDQREAQAEVIRQLVVQETRVGRAVVVLGDFNDFDGSIRDVAGNRPITTVVERIRSAGPGSGDDLRNVMEDVPQASRFTNHWDRNQNGIMEATEFSALDHILVSPSLYRRVREVQFVHAHDPLMVTDHFPVVVGFSTTASTAPTP